jgi:hypothetical protein
MNMTMTNAQPRGKKPADAESKGAKLRQACMEFADGEALIFWDGYDEAIVGVAEVEGDAHVVYDREAIVRVLMRRDGMDRQGAREFFNYNIGGASRGDGWPLWLHR